jgi:hypothetical protein
MVGLHWLGVTTPEGYYIGAQVIAIPLLLFSLALATHLLRWPGEQHDAAGGMKRFVSLCSDVH